MPQPLIFPERFLWGAATAAHQVEGNNTTSDWWEWETDPAPKAPMAGPSGIACDHFNRYKDDIALLAELGLNTYRFSVEWARVEPRQGEFDREALQHYADMVDTCLTHGVTPMITLQHFTLPAWVTHAGAWTNAGLPAWFARYTKHVMEHLQNRAPYICTINEPGNMITRGYLGTFPTPPFVRNLDAFDAAAAGVNAAHRNARDVIRELAPDVKVGMAHALQDWHANPGGVPAMEWARELHEDRFFAETAEDDFLGVQTYTRLDVNAPRVTKPFSAALLRSRRLTQSLALPYLHRQAAAVSAEGAPADGGRRTQMGYLWAPEAVEATARRVARLFPGKEIVLTEHGVGTDDDSERIDYIRAGLRVVHRMIDDGLPITGYVHWSLLDNFEWWDGYRPKYGLVAVDRSTQDRAVKPSAHWYGDVARTNRMQT
ncbi:glycoside hydrolase family 1 protein [Streptomyces sp. WI04-05B]|uniref:glycoside hydrolase family 1 protein n=1 Tax=Streptomyces TaxID=1883 RepID=UPI0029AA5E95|nr:MULTISPECIES: family 1 glycosylhydrolase [unclassified Streptomyces]MDX2546843.1 family 1 glycosylhydrolase [Streptomyces sp. WI04-05B]MDX2589639.1 family 1 glycosylhydrolase [Streptomyces sp. WI04-05A]